MKILIISNGRSGSTLVYESCMRYTNPEMVSRAGKVSDAWDECIASKPDTQQLEQLLQHLNSKENWTVKLHVSKMTQHNQSYYLKIARAADVVVRLSRRNKKQQAISYCISEMTGIWKNDINKNRYTIDKQHFYRELQYVYDDDQRLSGFPCDKRIYYEDLEYARQIYSLVTDIPVDQLQPMRDAIQKNNYTITNQQEVDHWYERFKYEKNPYRKST